MTGLTGAPSRNVTGPPNPAFVSNGDGFEADHSGDAAVNAGTARRHRLITFAAGDKSRVFEDVAPREAPFTPSWAYPREFRAVVDFQPPVIEPGDTTLPESVANTTQYFCTGDPEAGSPGWGFKLDPDPSPTLKGVVHDGTEELELPRTRRSNALPVPPSSGRMWLYGVQGTSGTLTLWVDGVNHFQGEITATGATGAERMITAAVENATPGDENRATDIEIRVEQWR